jgi:hypothetical protein
MSRKRPREKLLAPEPLAKLIDRAGESRFARNRPPIGPTTWTEVVGLRVAERARPVSLERGVLTVRAATNVWANELAMLSAAIVERLRARRIDVQTLKFVVGPVDPPARPVETRAFRRIPAPSRLPPELLPQLESVEDEGLRAAIEAAACAHLAWRAHVRGVSDAEATRAVFGREDPNDASGTGGKVIAERAPEDPLVAHLNVARRSSPSSR